MARRHNVRRVKIHRSYSVSEAAKLLGVSKHTLSRWIDAGLPLIEPKRPFLILGSELRAFVKARQPRKQPCRPGEIYCVRCRAPKRPAFDEADYIPKTPTTGQLAGLCPTCGSLIYRLTKTATLAVASGDLKVTRRPAQERLSDSAHPSLNVHFRRNEK
ncbi:helix-turn-helix domain-containing protein [Rhodoblastus sp. 17X3]|uniref:helix-turn-helix domain-containing protein n=1 Tax=Rhodoblastus sp. 17X3 TaxID=3047026 RepID=UPI0024B7239F|nr:helix-turn-helix domain-containing protein [Rhodoblastus sp. 17X3]MDI9847318.1 helix-turn-helix domain-containing protein [Rhodoblastus sp. 17X3]